MSYFSAEINTERKKLKVFMLADFFLNCQHLKFRKSHQVKKMGNFAHFD